MRGCRQTAAAVASRALSPAIGRYYRARGVEVGAGVGFRGLPVIERQGRLRLGDRVSLVSTPLLATLGTSGPCVLRSMKPDAWIDVGDDCGFTGVVILAGNGITIGKRVLCGPGVVITDSQGHPMLPVERRYLTARRSPDNEITIGDDVFLGLRTIVLPGVTIGAGSVVVAGSVVSRSIPAGVIAGGSPARAVRDLNQVEDLMRGGDPIVGRKR
jgi:NDP-sugar pyrophosphorylase family protein